MQWADSSSLDIVKQILIHHDTKYLLIIGAYRDNEINPAHVLKIAIDEMIKASVDVKTLILTPLSLEEVSHLLVDTLHRSTEDVRTLAELCHSRTGGNPFFLKQLLLYLHQNQ